MLTALILLAAAAQAAPAPRRPMLAKPCKPEFQMTRERATVRVRPLNEMPPAKQLLGVYREVQGCEEPAVVRERVGAPGRP